MGACAVPARKPFGVATPAFAQKAKKKPAAAPVQAYPINDDVDDPAVWGQVFPLQYELYLKTVDMTRTKYGGSEAMPHTPTQADPRSIVSRSKVEEDNGLKTMWQGYAFARSTHVIAYVSGVVGTLIGADLTNLHRIADLGAPVASIGGAGTFDGVFLTGIVAVLLARY